MSAPNPSTALAVTVIDELVRNGVARFVVSPGSRSAALALAAVSHPEAKVTVAIDERSAGFLGLGMGKAGEPAAVIVTSGTAVANLLPAVIESEMAEVPVVFLTADRPPELREVGANQTIDQLGIFGGHVRWFFEFGIAEDLPAANSFWRSTVCHAVSRARSAPAGPVHLNLPFREPLVPRSDDGRTRAEPFRSGLEGRPGGLPWTTRARGTMPPPVSLPPDWLEVERGIVVVGAGGCEPDVAGKIAAVLGWPLVVEATAGRRPAQAVSTAHHLASHPGFSAAHRPDAALLIGRTGLSRPLTSMIENARIATVGGPAGRWADPGRRVELVLPAPPLLEAGEGPRRSGDWRRSWLKAERTGRAALDAALDGFDEVSELRVARDTARAAGRVLAVASSMPVRDLDAVLEPGGPVVVSNRGASGIDGFVSTVLGLASVGGSVVALSGDLSMLHDQNGFLVDRRPDAVFVVIDNDGGGIFSFLPQVQEREHFERVFGTPHGRSFERYAAFHGLGHRSVERSSDLSSVVEEARRAGGVQLVVVHSDRGRNADQHRQVTAAVHRALDEAGF